MKKYLLLCFVLVFFYVIGINSANAEMTRQSITVNYGENFGRVTFKTQDDVFPNQHINYSNNFSINYQYNILTRLGVGFELGVVNYNNPITYSELYQYDTSNTDSVTGVDSMQLNINKTYNALVTVNTTVLRLGRFNTELQGGLGLGIHRVGSHVSGTELTYGNTEYPTSTGIDVSNSKTSTTFAYKIGINEVYSVSDTISLGIGLNYFNNGEPKVKVGDIDTSFKTKGAFNANFMLRFNL